MKRRSLLLLIGVWVILALGLVACGGGDADSNDTAANDADNSGEVADDGDEAEEVSAGDPQAGEELYNQVCTACHGEGGQGIEGLGKPFPTSEFIASQSDQELLEFIKQGRPVSHPDNTTGVDMPPKGGNPALSDQEILDIIAYIRTLQEE